MASRNSEQSLRVFWSGRIRVVQAVVAVLAASYLFPVAAYAVRAHYGRVLAPRLEKEGKFASYISQAMNTDRARQGEVPTTHHDKLPRLCRWLYIRGFQPDEINPRHNFIIRDNGSFNLFQYSSFLRPELMIKVLNGLKALFSYRYIAVDVLIIA